MSEVNTAENLDMPNEDWYVKEPDTCFNNKVLPVLTVVFACLPGATLVYALMWWLKGR